MTTLDTRPAPASSSSPDSELLLLAADLVITSQFGSPAMVQRKLRTTWDQTTAIVGALVEHGVLSSPAPDGTHTVLAPPEAAATVAATIHAALDRAATDSTLPATEDVDTSAPDALTPRPASGAELIPRPIHTPASTIPPSLVKRPAADVAIPDDDAGVEVSTAVRQLLTARPVWTITTLPKLSRLVEHPAAASTYRHGRVAVRVVWVVGQGGASAATRVWSAATHGVLREQIRVARAAGDMVTAREVSAQLSTERTERLERLLRMPSAAVAVIAVIGIVGVSIILVLVLIGGVAFIEQGAAGWTGWWDAVNTTVETAMAIAKYAVQIAAVAAVPIAARLAYLEGKRRGAPPRFLLTPDEKRLIDATITPAKVVLALRDLGIAELRKAILDAKDGGAGLLGPIAVAGCGVEVDVLLPSGVATNQVQARQRKLAENLDRKQHELFITLPPAARTVRLWIADPGALDKPIGPSPLVTDPGIRANFKTGKCPWGQNLRGDAVGIKLYQRHLLITGLSNQGKTAALRALALWAALDPRVILWIADLKGVGDWAMFDGLAEVLIQGPSDDHVIRATLMVEAAVEEMERRLQAGETDAPTLMVIVDEAQVAYMCPEKDEQGRQYGGQKNTSRYFMALRKIRNQGRAVNVLADEGTQDPTNSNLPKLIRESAHIRASLVVGTEEQARMAVGDKAVDGGAAPHLLRQGLDKGTLVVAGDGVDLPPGEAAITLRTHFVGDDDAVIVSNRAKERRRKARVAVTTSDGIAIEPAIDHLVDIAEAMRGEKRVRTVVLLGRLIESNADVYEPWGERDLAAALRQYQHFGLDIKKSDGQSVVRLEDVQRAMGERE